jgi:alpha-tubulin suppressor-like RCC1 family protein
MRNNIHGSSPWATACGLVPALVLAACGGGGGAESGSTPTAPTVASIELTPTTVDDFWGYSVQSQVAAKDSAGATISPRPVFTLTAADTSIASVDSATTTVSLLRPGSTTVTAASGGVSASATVNVRGFERLARVTHNTMCALADGRQRIYCWGRAGTTGSPMITSVPQQVQYVAPTPIPQGDIASGARIKKVVVATLSACALTDDGDIHCWGSNDRGALGIGTTDGQSTPARIAQGQVPAGTRFVDVDLSPWGGCAAGNDGRLYCWGDHNHIPNPALSANGPTLTPVVTVPGEVTPDVKIVTVVVDTDYGCALGDNGRAYCWQTAARSPRAVVQGAIPVNARLTDLQLGSGLPCALADNGQMYCWGAAFAYRFGAGLTGFLTNAAPTTVLDGAKPAGATFTALSVGASATASCAVADDANAYCWSKGYRGSLGDGDLAAHDAFTPTRVVTGEKDAAVRWTQVNCGRYTCTALGSDRRIYNWGANDDRMLSRDSQVVQSATPLMVTRPTRP